jgi:5-oxoprolinase (ATP-hydrolysing)
VSPAGELKTAKLLSENPESYADAATAGIRAVLGLPAGAPFPAGAIREVRMGTTVATNALLTRTGARTLLVVNEGFRDLLTIGHQARPELFALEVRLPAPLHEAVEEVGGRLSVGGELLTPLDEEAVAAMLARRRAEGLTSCAIALLHAWKHPGIERRVAALARAAGFLWVSASHEVSPSVGLVWRAATTVVDAYVSPVLRRYVQQVAQDLAHTPLQLMKSSGGLAAAADFTGKDAILSGPAGGVVGAVRTAQAAGEARIIAFDMGGTSTDVSLYDGQFERTYDTQVAGVPMRVPMMAVTTVAAGGGSILRFDGARFRVGPESAGAHPGPAAYRRGGPLTVTDANVLCGKILPEHFPAVFGPAGNEPLDRDVVAAKFAQLARQTGHAEPRDVAEGFLRVAVAGMAAAIKRVALERGRDVADFTLQCFGGAAGQHACLVAAELGMRRVLIHPLAGVLSAYGIGLAEPSVLKQQACELGLEETAAEALAAQARALEEEAVQALKSPGAPLRTQLSAQLRYQGTDTALEVPFGEVAGMRAAFEEAHRARFGFISPGRPLVVASLAAEAIGPGDKLRPAPPPGGGAAAALADIEMWCGGAARRAQVHDRARLTPGQRLTGPALIREALATTVLEPGWSAQLLEGGELLLTCAAAARRVATDPGRADPVHLELFSNLFMSVAEQMGAVLRSTSTSVNIKERLDYSCAVFDARGRLVANAPHVPVHLGSMGESVRTVLARRGGRLRPGERRDPEQSLQRRHPPAGRHRGHAGVR